MARLSSSVVLALAMTALPAAAKGVKGTDNNECLVPSFYESYTIVGSARFTADTVLGQTTFPVYTEIPFGENAHLNVGQASGQYFTVMGDADIGAGYETYACVHKRTKTDYEGLCTSTDNDGEEGPIFTVSVASIINFTCPWLHVALT